MDAGFRRGFVSAVPSGTLADLVERLERRAPEYIALLTAATTDEFESAFDSHLERAVRQLEANAALFADLDENGLTATLVMSLTIPGLTVTQETHSNGHVDLTIQADHCVPARVTLGEAKIYNGPAYHYGGIEQVLTRYATGRDERGLLIVYFRKPDIAGLVRTLRVDMDGALPHRQHGPTADHTMRWCFLSAHTHSCGELYRLVHVGCNLYRP
jgi:hypothetical protein